MHEPWDLSDPKERDLAAGEYVLGTHEAGQRAAFEALLSVSPDLQWQVAHWREHLQLLNDQLLPISPPSSLWPRIVQAAGIGPRPWLQRLGLWQALTVGLTVTTLSFGVLLLQAPKNSVVPGEAVFVVLDEEQVPGWIISANSEGELLAQAVQPSAMPAGIAGCATERYARRHGR